MVFVISIRVFLLYTTKIFIVFNEEENSGRLLEYNVSSFVNWVATLYIDLQLVKLPK